MLLVRCQWGGGDSLKVLVKEKCKRKSSNKDIKKNEKKIGKFFVKFKKKERESDLILYIYTQLVYACLGLGLFL